MLEQNQLGKINPIALMESWKIKSRALAGDFLFFMIPWVAIVIYLTRALQETQGWWQTTLRFALKTVGAGDKYFFICLVEIAMLQTPRSLHSTLSSSTPGCRLGGRTRRCPATSFRFQTSRETKNTQRTDSPQTEYRALSYSHLQ